jgi:hypothetical protein
MSIKYLVVEEENNLIRDTYSKAILNTDVTAVKRHENRIRQIEKEKQQESEINNLKQEIAEIKSLLLKMQSN